MFGLFQRRKATPSRVIRPRPLRRPLVFERLEDRCCPSIYLTLTATPMNVGTEVQLTGTVTGDQVAGDAVSFSGVVSGTTTTDASGNFSVLTNAFGLGTINAVASTSNLMESSNMASSVIAVMSPSLTLGVSYGSGRTVTLSGSVSDAQPGGLTVTFSGAATGSVTTNPDGTFSYTTQASGLGTVNATTVNVWGLKSSTAQVTLTDAAPQLTNFLAVNEGNGWWTLSGTVIDDTSAAGMKVYFSGIPGLGGVYATTNADGTFSLSVQLAPGQQGVLTAMAMDCWGLLSNTMAQPITT